MLIRFCVAIVLGVLVEAGLFAYVHQDALALTTGWPMWSTDRVEFEHRAARLLQEPEVTRQQLESIAARARVFGLPAIEAAALAIVSRREPADRDVRLRAADALRRAGDLHGAERVYTDLLIDARKAGPR
jgi:hypothetical protein